MNYLKPIYDEFNYKYFILNGKKPWSRGYYEYKIREIAKVLARAEFSDEELPPGYGFRIDERIIEYPWLLFRLPPGNGRLLDAGSILNYDYILSHPSLKSKKIFISTLGPETSCFWKKGISYIFEDFRDTCFKDNYFDWIVCLSTLEHVGMDNTMLYVDDQSKKENRPESYLKTIDQFRRILKPGGVLYLSIPFGRYKNHGWFQVFDSSMVNSITEAFDPRTFLEIYFKYEPDGWQISSKEAVKDATCFDIHEQKSYDPDFAAFSRGLACLELSK